MVETIKQLYSSRIIKAGALLNDTKTLLVQWDENFDVSENLHEFKQKNIFGKASRSRVEDILAIFRQRYLSVASITCALVTLAKSQLPPHVLDRILYFFAAQSDVLLHDIVTEVIWTAYKQGHSAVTVDSVFAALGQWCADGRMVKPWSESTMRRASRELMATLRDFGILQGKVKKYLAPVHLSVESFSFVAFYLKQHWPSQKLLDNPEWRLYFLSPSTVEHYLMEAHQHRLLEYYAAGSAVRITFPSETLEEYAHVIVPRAT